MLSTEHGDRSDRESLSDLYRVALEVLARALQSDDDRIALRAAQIVLTRSLRTAGVTASAGEKVITLIYGNDPTDQTAPRSIAGAGTSGALQSGGLRTALGQDGDGQDRRD